MVVVVVVAAVVVVVVQTLKKHCKGCVTVIEKKKSLELDNTGS